MTSDRHATPSAFHPAAPTSALIAALVGFGGTIALIVQAFTHLGAGQAELVSAVAALCLGKALFGGWLSWRLKMPVVLAWSTPGAALLAATTLSLDWPSAVGAFLVAAALMVLTGLVPQFARGVERIPSGIAAGMLAGVLLPFVMAMFKGLGADPLLVGGLLAVFVGMRLRWPLYAMLAVLAAAIVMMGVRGDFATLALGEGAWLAHPVLTMPRFTLDAAISLGVPLFLVTLMSQNIPGFVVLRAAGYEPPVQRLLFTTGLASLFAAPFGGHALNMAAITAAICTNEDAHPDKAQRWTVAMWYALFYLVLALFAGALVALFMAMPALMIAAIAGIALLAPLTGALQSMIADRDHLEAAMATFAATASGVTLYGIGSAFWGLVIGLAISGVQMLVGKRS